MKNSLHQTNQTTIMLFPFHYLKCSVHCHCFICDILNFAALASQFLFPHGCSALEKLLKGCSTKYATGNEIQLVCSSNLISLFVWAFLFEYVAAMLCDHGFMVLKNSVTLLHKNLYAHKQLKSTRQNYYCDEHFGDQKCLFKNMAL